MERWGRAGSPPLRRSSRFAGQPLSCFPFGDSSLSDTVDCNAANKQTGLLDWRLVEFTPTGLYNRAVKEDHLEAVRVGNHGSTPVLYPLLHQPTGDVFQETKVGLVDPYSSLHFLHVGMKVRE